MIMKRIVTLLIPLLFLVPGCSQNTNDLISGLQLLRDGRGIDSFYYLTKSKVEETIPTDLPKGEINEVMDASRSLAEIELASIFTKPEKYGDPDIYLDDAKKESIRFIVKNDSILQSKFTQYLPRLGSIPSKPPVKDEKATPGASDEKKPEAKQPEGSPPSKTVMDKKVDNVYKKNAPNINFDPPMIKDKGKEKK